MLMKYRTILPVVAMSFVLSLVNIQSGHAWGGDFSLYLAQAKSILLGNTHELFLMNKFSMDHSQIPLGPYLYPMGYPALLAPVYHFVGLNFIILKIYNLLFFLGSIPAVYKILKSLKVGNSIAYFSTLLFAINYNLIYSSDRLGSEFSFLFFCFLSLYLMLRSKNSKNIFLAILLGVTMFASFSVRVSGLILLPSFITFHLVEYLNNKRISVISFLLPIVVFGVCWWLYSSAFKSFDEHYLEVMKMTPESLQKTILANSEFLIEFVLCLKYFPDYLKIVSVVVFYPILILGISKLFKSDNLYLMVFCGSLLSIHMIVPFVDIRFLYPIAPFLLYTFLTGISVLQQKIFIVKNEKYKNLGYLLLLCLGFVQTFIITSVQAIKGTNKVYSKEMQEVYRFVNENIQDDEVIAFHKPRVLRLFTDNNSIYLHDYCGKEIDLVDLMLVKKNQSFCSDFQIYKQWDTYQLLSRIAD